MGKKEGGGVGLVGGRIRKKVNHSVLSNLERAAVKNYCSTFLKELPADVYTHALPLTHFTLECHEESAEGKRDKKDTESET